MEDKFFYSIPILYICSLNHLHMFTLDCNYYNKTFNSFVDLINDVVESGMDPNVEIVYNGEPSGEFPIDYIVF